MSNFPEKGMSFSAMTDYLTCPQYYKLKHLDKVLPHEASLDTECGTALHLGVNDILSGDGDGIEVALMYWDSLKHAELKKFSYDADQLRRCLEVWIAKFKKFYAKDFEPHVMEERMYGQIGGHAYQGTADFIGKYKGVPSIVDFKTSSQRYDKRKVITDDQMPGYDKLARDCVGYNAEQKVYLVFVKDRNEPSIQKPIIELLTEHCRSASIERVKAQIEDVAARTSFFKNTRSCIRGSIVCSAFEKCHGKGVENGN